MTGVERRMVEGRAEAKYESLPFRARGGAWRWGEHLFHFSALLSSVVLSTALLLGFTHLESGCFEFVHVAAAAAAAAKYATPCIPVVLGKLATALLPLLPLLLLVLAVDSAKAQRRSLDAHVRRLRVGAVPRERARSSERCLGPFTLAFE